MALFNITRYSCNDDSEAPSDIKSQEEEILQRLRQEAELRLQAKEGGNKRKRLLSAGDEDGQTKKKKKHFINNNLDNSENEKEDDVNQDLEQGTSSEEPNEKLTKEVSEISDVEDVENFTILGEAKHRQAKFVKRMLPGWLSHPSIVSSDLKGDRVRVKEVSGLDEQMVKLLKINGIKKFFPVQAQVIPALLRGNSHWLHLSGAAGYRPSDICCSAPTGSGKTLAYVVPIIQILRTRVVQRIRCLVVVPVGDLAAQVYQVFTSYCKHTNLRVGLVTGLKPFVQEQYSLVKKGPRGYYSLCDILVCTPGRLVDHIIKTPGFDLTHLRFMVIDEADRVMEEIKQDWLSLVEKAVFQEPSSYEQSIYSQSCQRTSATVLTADSLLKPQIPLQKLLFSATLSQDPEILNQIKLFQPVLFTSVVKPPKSKLNGSKVKDDESSSEAEGEFLDKFTTPIGLTEKFVESSKAQKPLVLLHLLCQLQFKHVLCFTNSVESTHRLYQLMKLVGRVTVKEFSSNLQTVRRNRILKQFIAGKIQLLISTDAMARGIDVSDIDCVVSYDVPRALTTYVHRVGRTSRAGRVGTAFTLLEKSEIFHFKKMLQQSGKNSAKELKLKTSELKPYIEPVQVALKSLPAVLKTEKSLSTSKK